MESGLFLAQQSKFDIKCEEYGGLLRCDIIKNIMKLKRTFHEWDNKLFDHSFW